MIATADTAVLFSPILAVAAISAIGVAGVYVLVARLVWHRTLGPLTIGALSSGYVNGNNIGLPVAVYLLGNAAFTAPIILLQLIVLAPTALVLLDAATHEGRRTVLGTVLNSLRNPLIIASLLGTVVAVTHFTVPPVVLEPLRLLGGASVPLMLTGFGLSLVRRAPARGRRRAVRTCCSPRSSKRSACRSWRGSSVRSCSACRPWSCTPPSCSRGCRPPRTCSTSRPATAPASRSRGTPGLITTIAAMPVLLVVSLLLVP